MTKRWTFVDSAEQVSAVLNKYVDEQYSAKQGTADNLRRALGSLVLERDGQSTNEFLRDAEYYFRGRLATGAHKHLLTSIIYGGGVYFLLEAYTGVKEVAVAAKYYGMSWPAKKLQTSKGSPVSLPGGARWYRQGAYDGFFDNPNATAKPVIPKHWPLFLAAGGALDLYDAIP